MFNALKNEINSILNEKASFGTFLENSVRPETNDEIWKQYKNIAILSVQYGDVALLPNVKGLTGSLQLQLLMRVEDGVMSMEALAEITDHLLQHSNGILQQSTNDSYYFVLTYGLPQTSGIIETTNTGIRYEVVTIDIGVTLSAELMLGERAQCQIAISGTYYAIDNIVSFILAPKTELDTSTTIEDHKTKSTVMAHSFGAQLVFRYNDSSTVHQYLYANCIQASNAITFQYKLPHENSWNSYEIITHDNTLTMPRGEFAVMTINMGLKF